MFTAITIVQTPRLLPFFACGYYLRVAFIPLGSWQIATMAEIGYMWAIQLGLIYTGSSTRSLSVLLSAMEMSPRTQTGLEITQWASVAIISMCVRVPCILAMATIQGWRLFHPELPIVQPLFKGSECSRVASNQRYMVYMHSSPLTCQVSVQPVNRKTKQVLHYLAVTDIGYLAAQSRVLLCSRRQDTSR